MYSYLENTDITNGGNNRYIEIFATASPSFKKLTNNQFQF